MKLSNIKVNNNDKFSFYNTYVNFNKAHYWSNEGEYYGHTTIQCTDLIKINQNSFVYIIRSCGGARYGNYILFENDKQSVVISKYYGGTPKDLVLLFGKDDIPANAAYIAVNAANEPDRYEEPYVCVSQYFNNTIQLYFDDIVKTYKIFTDISWKSLPTATPSSISNEYIAVYDNIIVSTLISDTIMFRINLYDEDKKSITNSDIANTSGEALGTGGMSGTFSGYEYLVPSGYGVRYIKVQKINEWKDIKHIFLSGEIHLIDSFERNKLQATNVVSKRKLVTIGDSLTANCIWQPYLAQYCDLNWSSSETVDGINNHGPVAKGGTAIRPTSADSIYFLGKNAIYYNPDIIFIYAGENDAILENRNTWGDNNLSAMELVETTSAYTGTSPDSNATSMSGYKGLIEYLLTNMKSVKIYLILPMRVRCDIGMTGTAGSYDGIVRFKDMNDVIAYDKLDRFRRYDYIKALGEYYGLPVIDLMNGCGITHYNETYYYGACAYDCTQVHCNEKGYEAMAKCMATYL